MILIRKEYFLKRGTTYNYLNSNKKWFIVSLEWLANCQDFKIFI